MSVVAISEPVSGGLFPPIPPEIANSSTWLSVP